VAEVIHRLEEAAFQIRLFPSIRMLLVISKEACNNHVQKISAILIRKRILTIRHFLVANFDKPFLGRLILAYYVLDSNILIDTLPMCNMASIFCCRIFSLILSS
jgi:hypothetical protein